MSSDLMALRSRSTRRSSRVASVMATASFARAVVAPRTPRTALTSGPPRARTSRATRVAQGPHEVAQGVRPPLRRGAADRVERCAPDGDAVGDTAERAHMVGRPDAEADHDRQGRVPADGRDERADVAAHLRARAGHAGERDAVDEPARGWQKLREPLLGCRRRVEIDAQQTGRSEGAIEVGAFL